MVKMERVPPEIKCLLLHFLTHISWVTSLPLLEQPRLSVVDWANYNHLEPQGPGTYAFGYDIEDPETNNVQFRDEERYPNGTVVGSYGFLKPDGNVHIVRYVADENGYRAKVEDSSGQPKLQGQPYYSVPGERNPSPTLLTALSSQDVYKQQTVHEQRLRPIDSNPGNSEPVVEFPKYNIPISKNLYDLANNDLQQSWLFGNDPTHYVQPKAYYIRQE